MQRKNGIKKATEKGAINLVSQTKMAIELGKRIGNSHCNSNGNNPFSLSPPPINNIIPSVSLMCTLRQNNAEII